MSGCVLVNGRIVDKPGTRTDPTSPIEVRQASRRYVSRGGEKLEKALDWFGIRVAGLTCLDIGASTGGFTDCLLAHGARLVYAVDVGYGLIAWSLRQDPRVVVLDRTNARYLTRDSFRRLVPGSGSVEWPTFATCDVSFISLLKIVPAVMSILERPWQMVLLVKPQFEAGREKVGSRGVVRDPEVHVEVLHRVTSGLTAKGQAVASGLTYSPLRGPEGNVEYLLWLTNAEGDEGSAVRESEDGRRGESDPSAWPFSVSGVVREAMTLGTR